MKRCPQCNRAETDASLKFCRIDGATLISESSGLAGEAGTAQLDAPPDASEVHTSILPHTTDAVINRGTAPTTVLPPANIPGTTRELSKPRGRNAVVIVALLALVAGVITIGGYFFSRARAARLSNQSPYCRSKTAAEVRIRITSQMASLNLSYIVFLNCPI